VGFLLVHVVVLNRGGERLLIGIRITGTKERWGCQGLSSSLFKVHASAYGWQGIVAIVISYNGFM
jgi:hypothetical protein